MTAPWSLVQGGNVARATEKCRQLVNSVRLNIKKREELVQGQGYGKDDPLRSLA